MRYLGLDVGDRTIGVALSDETATLATGILTIRRQSSHKDLSALADLVREHDVKEVIVGLPRSLNGSIGPQAQKVLAFIEAARARLGVPIVSWDERYTTRAAERALIEGGVSRRKRREIVDTVSAVLILQGYLDYKKMASAEANEPLP